MHEHGWTDPQFVVEIVMFSNYSVQLCFSVQLCSVHAVATSLESLVCSLIGVVHSWSQVQRSANRQFSVARVY